MNATLRAQWRLALRKFSPELTSIIFAALVVAGIWSVAFWKLEEDRREVFSAATSELLGAQNLLSAQFARAVDAAVSLADATDSWMAEQKVPPGSVPDVAELANVISKSAARQTFPSVVRLFDAAGDRLDLPIFAEPRFNVADREYIAALDGKGPDYFRIGLQGVALGVSAVPVAKLARNNVFGARFIVAGFHTRELDQLFDRVFVSAPGYIGAFRDDGYLVYRNPDPEKYTGIKLDLDYFMGPAAGRNDQGMILGRSDPDGRRLMIAYKRVDNLPLYVYASFRTDDLEARSAARRPVYFGFASVATLLSLGMAGLISFFARVREHEAEALRTALVEAGRANNAKREFLANISHELRTPLNAIIGLSEMMEAGYFGALTAKNAEYNADVLKAGRHLLSLVDQLLDVASIEAGRSQITIEELAPGSVVRDAMKMLAPRALAGGVRIEFVAPAREFSMRSDRRVVRQILLNLLDNAVKFTPKGGCVRVVLRKSEENVVEFLVIDEGPGIEAKNLPYIFEAFWRDAAAYVARPDGLGLGLLLTKQMTGQLGGEISVKCTPGRGSEFKVAIPAEAAAPPEAERLRKIS